MTRSRLGTLFMLFIQSDWDRNWLISTISLAPAFAVTFIQLLLLSQNGTKEQSPKGTGASLFDAANEQSSVYCQPFQAFPVIAGVPSRMINEQVQAGTLVVQPAFVKLISSTFPTCVLQLASEKPRSWYPPPLATNDPCVAPDKPIQGSNAKQSPSGVLLSNVQLLTEIPQLASSGAHMYMDKSTQ